MKKSVYLLFSLFVFCSCTDFLDRNPADALSSATFWKTEKDAEMALTACYDGWISSYDLLSYDCTSDNGFCFHPGGKIQQIGNGSMSPNEVKNFYDYKVIVRCNTFLANINNVPFVDESKRDNMIGQVKTIRAYRYAYLSTLYGNVPLITEPTKTIEEAQIPSNTKREVYDFVFKELEDAIKLLPVNETQKGRITKGGAMALKMRYLLYDEKFEQALDMAKKVVALNKYSLVLDISKLFGILYEDNSEYIISDQKLVDIYPMWMLQELLNNGDGGWSSYIPTQDLVDAFETMDGLTIKEAETIGKFDPKHPFVDRDPRLRQFILYPGQDWEGRIFNSLDKEVNGSTNPDYPMASNNSSKSGYTVAKYVRPLNQYPKSYSDGFDFYLIRYAEVLLTMAESKVELGQIDDELYSAIDDVRLRAGMPATDREKYNNQKALRELVRRERRVELMYEGLRREDILRWKDDAGKMLAETVLNKSLMRNTGTVNYNETNPDLRATYHYPLVQEVLEKRVFAKQNRHLPIPQAELDKNPNLKQIDY